MTIRNTIARLVANEDLNFLLTNRLPRHAATRFMGWYSRIESPLLTRMSIAIWQLFTDLDLNEAKATRFRSLHACFTRELKPGLRPVDPDPTVICSPSDAIVGACGPVQGTEVIQAKGFPYRIADLLGSEELAERYRDGSYVTLRLTSAMYHRFHSPDDCVVDRVTYISGDTWNVNPVALKRVERLFCKNERAVIEARLAHDDTPLLLVPVAAILVASIRLHWLDVLLHLRYRGPNHIPCHAAFRRGEEMGWFEHGSTIIVFVPKCYSLCPEIAEGRGLKMGARLLQRQG
mgnify:FL=1